MKTLAFKGLAIFFVLLVVTSIMMDASTTQFGTVNFWDKHGIFFLIFITFFPRLTLLFSSVATGGFIWWLGFFFFPRILVATLATVAYFHTNPVLVTLAWIVAIGGETMEKAGVGRSRSKFVFRTVRPSYQTYQTYEEPRAHTTIKSDDAIEAEFTKKS